MNPGPGRTLDLDQDALRGLMKCYPRKNTRELAHDINTFQSKNLPPLEKDRKSEQDGRLRRIRMIAYP